VPTEIPFFKDYCVKDLSVGQQMALIVASPKDDENTTKFFCTGDVKGVNTSSITNDSIVHLKDFDNLKYRWVEAGEEV